MPQNFRIPQPVTNMGLLPCAGFLFRCVRFVASFSTCNALCKEVFQHDPMFRHRSATPAGLTGNGAVRSLGDNVTSILGSAGDARADTATASITAVGASSPDQVNPGEVLIKAVIKDKPKMLSGLDQKGTWSGPGAPSSPGADGAPPADRHDLTPGRSRR